MMKVRKSVNNQSEGLGPQIKGNVSFWMITVALGTLAGHSEVGTALGSLPVLSSTIALSSILKEMFICNNSVIFPFQ